jgi:hypothetical protein
LKTAARPWEEQRHRGAECGELRQREIDEDHATFDDVHAEISMDASQNETGRKWRGEKLDDRQIHGVLTARPLS